MNRNKNSNSSDESKQKQITFDEVSNEDTNPQSEYETDWEFFVESMWIILEICIVIFGLFYMIHKGIIVEIVITSVTMHIVLNMVGVKWKPWK